MILLGRNCGRSWSPFWRKIREIVGELAKSAAADLPELRAKATILALLLRPGNDGAGPTIPKPEREALALSLAEDVARLPDG